MFLSSIWFERLNSFHVTKQAFWLKTLAKARQVLRVSKYTAYYFDEQYEQHFVMWDSQTRHGTVETPGKEFLLYYNIHLFCFFFFGLQLIINFNLP